MKTFINVLYRRILYKIPLKLLLILIAIFGILFACFSSADYLDGFQYVTNINHNGNTTYSSSFGSLGFPDKDGFFCIRFNSSLDSYLVSVGANDYNNIRLRRAGFGCFGYGKGSQNAVFTVSSYSNPGAKISFNADVYYLDYNFTFTSGNPGYTSLQCQTEYNLIPISSVDQNYCTTNNLCPSQECPSVPIGTGGLSQLYINNILHVGAPTILMNIPEEINWDYAYTQGGNIMNIDIVGYNVDYQAIEDQITIQKYKPTNQELSTIISGLIPLFVPGLCIILLLYFIFKFIKKVF